MNYLLFTVYLLILCWLLLRLPVIKKIGLNKKPVLALFLCKIVAGIAIGWVSIHIYGPGNDYWDLNDAAWKEYQLLLTHPGTYFTNIFTSGYPGGYGGLFSSFNSYWNDLKGNLLIKLVSMFNILSRGDYYINSLFFNFIIFFGHVVFYKFFVAVFKERKWLVVVGCFLIPSTLYFTSGMHKDGIVFLLLSILIYCVYRWLQQNKITVKRLLLIVVSFILLFLIRNYIFIALVPALLAWIFTQKTKWKPAFVFAAVYFIAGLLVFNVDVLFSKIKPLNIIITKQTEFLNLPHTETTISLTPLQPTFKSFAANAPEAFNHLLLRPYLWELPVVLLLPLNIELLICQLLFLLYIFYHKKLTINCRGLIYFLVFFCITMFLLIGYIVPNLGSLVGNRSVYLPLIITLQLCLIQWEKIH
ncbi:MAG: hypothetical protein R2765_04015 [Ferruginibacter sp.]